MAEREPVPPRRITPLATPTYVAAGSGFPFTEGHLVTLVRSALDEDHAFDDLTTISTVIATRRARASLVARESGVVAGVLPEARIVAPVIQQSFYLAVGGRRQPGAAVSAVAELVRAQAPAIAA